MTIAPCPHGCGNYVNYADNLNYCPGCRRDLDTVEVQPPGSCWAWWGPITHRMRCRLPKRHEGPHDTHEERANCMIVSTEGELVTAIDGPSETEGDAK